MVRQRIRIASTANRVPQYALFHAQCIVAPTILVAPCAFKGTLGPREVTEALSAGIRRALPEAAVLQCPVSDGGDGLLEAVLPPEALRERVQVTGPLGMPVAGDLGWLDHETAIFESATACGIALLRPDELDPLRTTTRGVGELILEAVERGASITTTRPISCALSFATPAISDLASTTTTRPPCDEPPTTSTIGSCSTQARAIPALRRLRWPPRTASSLQLAKRSSTSNQKETS